MTLIQKGVPGRYYYQSPGSETGIADLVLDVLDSSGSVITSSPCEETNEPGVYRNTIQIVIGDSNTEYVFRWSSATVGISATEAFGAFSIGSVEDRDGRTITIGDPR